MGNVILAPTVQAEAQPVNRAAAAVPWQLFDGKALFRGKLTAGHDGFPLAASVLANFSLLKQTSYPTYTSVVHYYVDFTVGFCHVKRTGTALTPSAWRAPSTGASSSAVNPFFKRIEGNECTVAKAA